MLINCALLFDEVWMLKMRLEYEYDLYDRFVIVEETRSHAGRPKLMYFEKYKEDFKPYLDKIIYVPVSDSLPVRQETYVGSNGRIAPENRLPTERFARNCIRRGLAQIQMPPGSIIFVQDMDEMVSAETVKHTAENLGPNEIFQFFITDYRATVAPEGRQPNPFQGGYAIRSELQDFDIQLFRRARYKDGKVTSPRRKLYLTEEELTANVKMSQLLPSDLKITQVPDAGWHFSHMSGGYLPFQTLKMQNFGHSESSTSGNEILDVRTDYHEKLTQSMASNMNLFDFENVDPGLPDFIKENIRRYPMLLLPRDGTVLH